MQTDEGPIRCPQCGQQVPRETQYVTWCDKCEWNVDPTGPTEQVPAWRQQLDHRLAATLYAELERGAIQRPGWDAARIAAYALSAGLLLLPLAGLLGGIAMLVFYRPLWLSALLSVIPLGLALTLRPRANCLPPDTRLVYRQQAPLLFALLDKIAAAVGTKPVSAVALDAAPNLYYTRVGWRFMPVVGIGLPLWAALRPQERVAVLAHELGHGKNGDTRHGWVVGSAMTILDELEETFSEQPLDEYRQELIYATEANTGPSVITRLVNATVGGAVRAVKWLLTRIDLRSGQRAEYLADRRAAEIAGSEETARALEKLVLSETSYRALERAVRFGSDVEPLQAVTRAIGQVPAREIDRRLRVSRLRDTRIDATHPPTNLRAKLIRTKPAASALVVLGTDESRAIDRELAGPAEAVLTELRSELR
ncbi:M48 family metallopeptidase [Kribbella sp. CA-293567]|uniref:M48 family metallopeptidase n=1 Tax=Kribbella sp. CA-293567 TaxID=3002436 RepID=UPI0022DDACEA|nr:M48 family metallopeptidase [Kribbella sp. CA-293567]WBQ06521.1 M48 family metallopeptidase [Kribbella sp. CA-293567]